MTTAPLGCASSWSERVWDIGFRVYGVGFRVDGVGFRV